MNYGIYTLLSINPRRCAEIGLLRRINGSHRLEDIYGWWEIDHGKMFFYEHYKKYLKKLEKK